MPTGSTPIVTVNGAPIYTPGEHWINLTTCVVVTVR